ncbi:hypothetical protein EYC80_003882 [Monilinia laxa]|uniref:Uncharacterized protein n=1 Tax=Monilinia laxa TaxID=61186 RepID=A0A5N6KL23_MONLA|nr:hypothetical protein EYC80_003882 [Monilinia laxa]
MNSSENQSSGTYSTLSLIDATVTNKVTSASDTSSSFMDSNLIPWVTVDASGHASTVTPILTIIDGKATTINAAPVILTATGISSTDGTTTTTPTSGEVVPTSTGGGAFEICHNLKGKFAPFFTWDTQYFAGSNTSVFIQANYVNASGGGLQAFQSIPTNNNLGFIAWTIDKSWLKGMKFNNVTLFITPTQKTTVSSVQGPTLMVIASPAPDPYRQSPSKAPNGASLYIALPVVLAFVAAVIGGTFYCNRKHRTIGMGSAMGRRKGYRTGSRRQRMGLGKKKDRAIMLRDQELTADGQYRDVPTLRAEDPTMHYRDETSWDNNEHFKDETKWHAGSRL